MQTNLDSIQLVDAPDDTIREHWTRLSSVYGDGAHDDTLKYVECSASLVAQEMIRRGIDVEDGPLLKAAKQRASLSERVRMLPDELETDGSVELHLVDETLLLVKSRGKPDGGVAKALRRVGVPATGALEPGQRPSKSMRLYDVVLRKTPGAGPLEANAAPPGLVVEAHEEKGAARYVACSRPTKQIIYYLVSEPETPDFYGHRISADVIEDALHGYVAKSREVKLEHDKTVTGKAVVVEAYIAPADLGEFHGAELPDGPIKRGSSIVAIHYPDPDLWSKLSQTEHGISWGGMARRVKK